MSTRKKCMIAASLSSIYFLCIMAVACTYDTQRTDEDCNGTDIISCQGGSYGERECLVCAEKSYGGGYYCTCISGTKRGQCEHSTSGMCHKERTTYREEYTFDLIHATDWSETPNRMCVIKTL